MREVFIISTGEILGGRTASSRRIQNIAKSIAAGNINVYLCSLSGIRSRDFHFREVNERTFALQPVAEGGGKGGGVIRFMQNLNKKLEINDSEKVIYLYPTTFIFKDLIYLLYFKYLKGYRFFCEINELRSAIAFSSDPPSAILPRVIYYIKSVKDYMLFKVNELQVGLYDGIVVISTSLMDYFSDSARRIIRVPILCDADQIDTTKEQVGFEGSIFKICFAGYIKAEKEGFDLLFEALAKINNESPVELYLYGIFTDEDKVKLTAFTHKYDISQRIFYMGNIDPENLQDEFDKYHLLILPRPLNRRTRFGFSTKLSEYLVSAKPVLLTDVSDNSLFIQDGHNGYLIQPGDVEAMTSKLREIINSYNSQAAGIVINAHKLVRDVLDYRHYTNIFSNFFFDGSNEPDYPVVNKKFE